MNNKVKLVGVVTTEPELNHVAHDKYYKVHIAVKRTSQVEDVIPVIYNPDEVNTKMLKLGATITVDGEYRSYNNNGKLSLNLFAKDFSSANINDNHNNIFLNGYICKPPIYRPTPLGRKICDIILAVNRKSGRCDYIPCIVWGNKAEEVSKLKVGANIQINGRIQSRAYTKKFEDGTELVKTAYEVSVGDYKIVGDGYDIQQTM